MSAADPGDTKSASSFTSAIELRVAEYWAREGVPEKALALNPQGPAFRFTEGPPTANGKPHMGHLLTRALKDAILRYRRMKGYRIVTSMAGWDCHGLPVELEVEKAHGWKNKREIPNYGLDRFAQECRTSVRRYEGLWRDMSRRVGYWLDYDHAYFTMDKDYIESVWWSLKELHGRGLLEKGSYVVPYCPRCETPEAAHEVAQGYREVEDPSVTVEMEILDRPPGSRPRHLLVWTTTPWTLPSNLALAVSPGMEYVVFNGGSGTELVMARPALERYFPDPASRPAVLDVLRGETLTGLRYRPLFPDVTPGGEGRHAVYPADFVSSEEGTGIVHIAPSFGADDFALGEKHHLGFFDPLDSSGRFTDAVPLVRGKTFKSADPILSAHLKERGLLWKEERIRHTYPFCYRCGHPLIYRALETWFIRTHRVTEKLVSNNSTVAWTPAHIRGGRFGNFIAEGKDWALSRNRYWGTPLPIWNCPGGHSVAVGSYRELEKFSGTPLPPDFDPHKPFVDEVPLTCSEHGARMTREPYVIDCWYDSGAAPFAQYHWPFASNSSPFDPAGPLDFVAEGIDQTRGWFYSLLVTSTLLFDRPAYRSVLVNGLVLDEKGQKQSKSIGNVTDPVALMERLGADAPRLTFYLGPYTEPFRFSEYLVRTTGAKALSTLVNVAEFYRSNRLADQYTPPETPPLPTLPLDRWLLSQLDGLIDVAGRAFEVMDLHSAATAVDRFVDKLSTWYLRRSRPRFWSDGVGADKSDAYATMAYTLSTLSRVMAPLTPHIAEYVFQVATSSEFSVPGRSVHLEPWPGTHGYADRSLDEAMDRIIAVVEAGRNLRMQAKVKSRIPLAELVVSGLPAPDREKLGPSVTDLVAGELNVKRIDFVTPEEFGVRAFPEEAWVVLSTAEHLTVALTRVPTRELVLEGLSREMIRRIQTARKEERLQYTDTIEVKLTLGPNLAEALAVHRDLIVKECQISSLEASGGPPEETAGQAYAWEDVGGDRMALILKRAGAPAPPSSPSGSPPQRSPTGI